MATQAYKTGISDFLFNHKPARNKPPYWMDKEERKDWRVGYEHARDLCFNQIKTK